MRSWGQAQLRCCYGIIWQFIILQVTGKVVIIRQHIKVTMPTQIKENHTLLAGFLRDKGIHAIVSADDEAGLSPNLATLRRVRVLVQHRDAARAKQLVADANGT